MDQQAGSRATLADRLRSAADGNGSLIVVSERGEASAWSYGELLSRALIVGGGLAVRNVLPGRMALLQTSDGNEFFEAFWGCVVAGVIPVPLPVVPTFAAPNSALQKLVDALEMLEDAVIICGEGVAETAMETAGPWSEKGRVLPLASLKSDGSLDEPVRLEAEEIAVLLMTSGSSGRPKIVPLSHRNLLAMAAGTAAMSGFSASDVTLNWMALDHVGSISFLGTMATDLGCTQIHVPTGYILQNPIRWLDLIDRYRATISWAPNFAFSLFLERSAEVEAGRWDLSSMRFLVNAGEPVVASTARRFIRLLQKQGLPGNALRPAFGMSETCSGITWSRGFTLENTSDRQSFVDLGPCIPGAEMRVVDADGKQLPEGESGQLQFRGPSVFSGYYSNPEENRNVFSADGWFDSGDLAYLKGGTLFITGRQKDVIIVNGANFYCHEIESALEEIPGVRRTFTGACAVRGEADSTDRLAVFLVPETTEPALLQNLARAVRTRLIQSVGLPLGYLVALDPEEVPKTEIGKIQRSKLRDAFHKGIFEDRYLVQPSVRKKQRRERVSGGGLLNGIAAIWQDVLGLDQVGLDETFFELGGHSILVVQVQQRLEELVGRPVAVTELFNCPTVRALAGHFQPELGPEPTAPASTAATFTPTASRDIAVIGLGIRFPGADDPDAFWRLLEEGREAITFFSEEEAIAAGVRPELAGNPRHVKAVPMLDEPGAFDAEFFRYNAREARLIDPQQRVFLEVCWEAFEDAGYDPLTLAEKVGIYAACGMNSYLVNNLFANGEFLRGENGGRMLTVDSMNGFNVMITNDKDYLPTRVAFKLNLRGPAINVQTACSSTLVTLHEACKSLLAGDCQLALAGGVSIKLPQQAGHLYSEGMLNSPDGHCRAYDAAAEGTIFGNGAGVVLLKPLTDAERDGDRIYAVVKGTAINNDGAGKVGFTAPSEAGEEGVCAEAIVRSGVSAESIGFVEGHGTGTPMGDPIEVEALSKAFRRSTSKTGFCALGSVKSNLGHMQIASGIAGLIKTVLALHHKKIPGTVHFERPNPRIDFARTPFFVNAATIPWEANGAPRRAGVNSLGIGGTNAHAILEEAPVSESVRAATEEPRLLPLSARNVTALGELVGKYRAHLDWHSDLDLAALAFTAQSGRHHFQQRAAFVFRDLPDLRRRLKDFAPSDTSSNSPDLERDGVAWLFTGQGAQHAGMGRALHAAEPVFREAFDTCAKYLQVTENIDLAQVLRENESGTPIDDTAFAQPALFAVEYAAARLLESYGMAPAVMIGHSIGEMVAACLAEVFSLEDALRLVAARGRLMGSLPAGGAMVAVATDTAGVESFLTGLETSITVAAANSPHNTVLSGDADALAEIGDKLAEAGIKVTSLKVSHAFHSHRMDPMLAEFRSILESIELQPPVRKIVSNLTGCLVGDEMATADYWVRHVREPVRFIDGMRVAADLGIKVFLETGPKPTLCGMGAETLTGDSFHWIPLQRKADTGVRDFCNCLARLYTLGAPVDFIRGNRAKREARIGLPTYPWQRQLYWIEGTDFHAQTAAAGGLAEGDPLVGRKWRSPRIRETIYETVLSGRSPDVLGEHRVHGRVVVPGAFFLSQLCAQAKDFFGTAECVLKDLIFAQPMILDEPAGRVSQTILAPADTAGTHVLEICGFSDGNTDQMMSHVTGSVAKREDASFEDPDIEAIYHRCREVVSPESHYTDLAERRIELGPQYHWIREIRSATGEALIHLQPPSDALQSEMPRLPAGLVDSMLQAAIHAVDPEKGVSMIPFRIERLDLLRRPRSGENLWSHATARGRSADGRGHIADIALYSENGAAVMLIEGFELRVAEAILFASQDPEEESAEAVRLEWDALEVAHAPDLASRFLLIAGNSALADAVRGELLRSGRPVESISIEGVSEAIRGMRLGTHIVCVPPPASVETVTADCDSAFELVRNLAPLPAGTVGGLTWITSGAVGVNGRDEMNPADALHWGIARALAFEHPEWAPSVVDLECGVTATGRLLEALSASSAEDRLAIRDETIFAARLRNIPASDKAASIDSKGSFIVTGANGGLGLKTADWLVVRGVRYLLLNSRGKPTPELAAAIDRWEGAGAQVFFVRGDIADASTVEEVVTEARLLAPIRGVFHAAGVLADGLAVGLEPSRFAEVVRPKLAGSWQLHKGTIDDALDHFVLFSSIASLLGSPAQANYAVGNAFLDALADCRRAQGLPALSVQWGPWDATGMSARLDAPSLRRLSERGLRPLKPDDAFAWLDRLLAGESGVAGVLAWDRDAYRKSLGAELPGFYHGVLGTTPERVRPGIETTTTTAPSSVGDFERLIRETIATVIGLGSYRDVGREQGLFDLGLDSLMAVDVKNRLQHRLGRTLRATIAFDYPTVAAMAGYLASESVSASNDPKEIDLSEDDLAEQLARELAE